MFVFLRAMHDQSFARSKRHIKRLGDKIKGKFDWPAVNLGFWQFFVFSPLWLTKFKPDHNRCP